MSAVSPDTNKPATNSRSRRWLIAVFFLCWTVLTAVALSWLIGDNSKSGDTVIRISPGEVKAWSVRMHESVTLARLNFPWAIAWIVLTPYVIWVGVRYSFEVTRWRTLLTVLLATGAGFIWVSQWLSERLASGRGSIVLVNYADDTAVERTHPAGNNSGDPLLDHLLANHLITNRITKVMLSGESADPRNQAAWEIASSRILSGSATNLPHLITGGVAEDLPPPILLRKGRWSAVLDGFAFVALIGLAHAGIFHRRYREREQQAVLLESRLNQARLRALQAQFQPHFLFNTLNGIATLLRRDPAAAEEMLLSLSELLRISLSSSHRQEIPLREELDFLDRYLAIQRMRFGDRLQVKEEIAASAMDCLVPALLLQPLVENSIRHGLEPSGQPGKLRITAVREGEWLRLKVEDNGVGLPSGDQRQPGIGLANVRERLATLHDGAHEFSIANRPEGGVVVNIRLPARTEIDAAGEKEIFIA